MKKSSHLRSIREEIVTIIKAVDPRQQPHWEDRGEHPVRLHLTCRTKGRRVWIDFDEDKFISGASLHVDIADCGQSDKWYKSQAVITRRRFAILFCAVLWETSAVEYEKFLADVLSEDERQALGLTENGSTSAAEVGLAMSFVMMRSFADAMGMKWPKNAAMKVGDYRSPQGFRFVTWAELHEERRTRQAKILKRIRRPPEPFVVPCFVWTFFVPGFIYYGWHCYIVTRTFEVGVTFRDFDEKLAESVMKAVPMGMLPMTENFIVWMEKLAKQHPRKHPRDKRKAGSVVGWLENRRRFTLDRPSNVS